MVVRLKLRISRKNISYLNQNNLHAFVRQCASPSDISSHLLQNLTLCLHFFPLPDYYLISEIMYSWCAVSVFGIPLCSWASARGGQNGHLLPPGNWDWKPKICRKPEVSSLIDLILAMTVLFSDMTLTVTMRKSQVHCCGVMHWWACGSLMSAIACRGRLQNLGADCYKIGLYFVTISWQRFTSSYA